MALNKNRKEMLGDQVLASTCAAEFQITALRKESLKTLQVRSAVCKEQGSPLHSKQWLQHEAFPQETPVSQLQGALLPK